MKENWLINITQIIKPAGDLGSPITLCKGYVQELSSPKVVRALLGSGSRPRSTPVLIKAHYADITVGGQYYMSGQRTQITSNDGPSTPGIEATFVWNSPASSIKGELAFIPRIAPSCPPHQLRLIHNNLGGKRIFGTAARSPEQLVSAGLSQEQQFEIHKGMKEYLARESLRGLLYGAGLSRDDVRQTLQNVTDDPDKLLHQSAEDISRLRQFVPEEAIPNLFRRSLRKTGGKLNPEHHPEIFKHLLLKSLRFLRDNNGDTYGMTKTLLKSFGKITKDKKRLLGLFREMAADGEVSFRFTAKNGLDGFMLNEYSQAEDKITDSISGLLSTPPAFEIDVDAIEERINEAGFPINKMQRKALDMVAENKLSLVTGDPGTGKTTITHYILAGVENTGATMAMLAPTGQAANRLKEASGQETSTIHRAIGYREDENGIGFATKDIEANFVYIDESSMIDTMLMSALLSAIPKEARVIFSGDTNQLPSISAGATLRDMINASLPSVHLNEPVRQDKASGILQVAQVVRTGRRLESIVRRYRDFRVTGINDQTESDELNKIIEGVCHAKDKGFTNDDIQVLTPIHKGKCGVAALNKTLRPILNEEGLKRPLASFEIINGDRLAMFDRVRHTKNDYETGLMNGDIGKVVSILDNGRKVRVKFDGEYHEFDSSNAQQLLLNYATTIHSSQGSQYPAVIMTTPKAGARLLSRQLVYTGITRTEKYLEIVGSPNMIDKAANNNSDGSRKTFLRHSIKNELQAIGFKATVATQVDLTKPHAETPIPEPDEDQVDYDDEDLNETDKQRANQQTTQLSMGM